MPPVLPGGNIFRLQLRGPFKAHGGAKKGQIYSENHDGAAWRVGWLIGSPAGRTDGIEWFGWVLALIGALVCMTGCELYKCYVKHFAPPPI